MFKSKIALLFIFSMLAGTPLFSQINDKQPDQVEKVSDTDLKKFAQAYQEIQTENRKAQQEMATVIKNEGLEPKRFNEIRQATTNPNSTAKISEEEMMKHNKASEELQKLQTRFQTKMKTIINDQGLTMTRFNEIFTSVKQNPALQQKVQDILAKG